VSVSRVLGIVVAVLLLGLMVFGVGCAMPRAQKGGACMTTTRRPGQTHSVALRQPDNPGEPSSQTVHSEQVIEYGWPPAALTASVLLDERAMAGSAPQALPVRVISKDRTETRIGSAQKDTAREWTGKAANLQPVMWAGITMMTLVAGALFYFGWWTKGAVALAVGGGMIVLAQTLPDYGHLILVAGLTLFALTAFLVLYAYHKGQLDRNNNGMPDPFQRGDALPF
jgi:hypothetical protein